MQSITNNPYRILGLLAGASAREITRQTNNLRQYIAAALEPPADYSFSALDNFQRSIEDIDVAPAKLNLDEDKMFAALFWFWKGNDITDEPAFYALMAGDIKTAYQIWDKLVVQTNEENKRFWNNVTARNASAFHNQAVLALLNNAVGSYVSAVMANIMFIESDYFSEFVKSTVDVTYKVSKKNIELKFLDVITSEITNKKTATSLSQVVKYLNGYDFSAKADFLKSVSQKFTANITAQIEIARKSRTANKQNAATAGENLYKNTKNDLLQVTEIFGAQDFAYSNVADKVANELLQCSIDFFNDSQDKELDNGYHEKASNLANLAQNIAAGQIVKQRAKENLQTLEKMKDREFLQTIAILQLAKDAYETNKAKITAQVRIQEMSLSWGQSINWSKVDEMIENSIDWNKVVELIQQAITVQNVNKIRNTVNTTKIDEYKALVKFILGKLNRSQRAKVNYLDWWSSNTSSTTTRTLQTPPASTYTHKKESWASENIGCVVMMVIAAIIALIVMFNS